MNDKRGQVRKRTELIIGFVLWIVLGVLILLFSILSPSFFTFRNMMNILLQVSIIGLIAIGMTFVILTAGIDLSVGSLVALSGLAVGFLARETDSVILPILGAIGVGAAYGSIFNGIPIAFINVTPFIVTLASMSIARGATLIFSGAHPIYGLNDHFLSFAPFRVMGIPVPAIIFLAVFFLAYFFQRHMLLARYIYAVGDNEHAAELTGISRKGIKLLVYTSCGALTGLATAILTSRVGGAEPQVGVGYELSAIAAVVIGGTSLFGGRGGVQKTMVGVLLIGIINNGFNLCGIQSYYQIVVRGFIILLAVILDRWKYAIEE